MLGSDYSGDHATSRYRTYCFLVADADSSPEWPARTRRAREAHLTNGRRMSFKGLNDGQRRRALVPFLEAAEYLAGYVVGIVVSKELDRLSTGANTLALWKSLHGLRANWSPRAFEALARVAHFHALLLRVWSRPGMHVSWITDQDEIVANEDRLDDALDLSARITGLYVPHGLGEFAMNTVAVEPKDQSFEDFVAIPDLAAGMLTEVVNQWSSAPMWSEGGTLELAADRLTEKGRIIADWFWHPSGSLRKMSILIDRFDESRFTVVEMAVGK